MQFSVLYTIVVATFILAYFYDANAINLEESQEGSCFDISETVSLDVDWVMSEKIWYYPLMSRYEIYHKAIDLSGKSPADLQEDEIYYDSCITFTMKPRMYIAKGFGNKTMAYNTIRIKDYQVYELSVDNEELNRKGKCYNTLTDNKTFFFGACCMSDGQMTWAAVSSIKELPEETRKLIYDHAISLGFKREYFTGLRYDSCKDNSDNKQTPFKNEL